MSQHVLSTACSPLGVLQYARHVEARRSVARSPRERLHVPGSTRGMSLRYKRLVSMQDEDAPMNCLSDKAHGKIRLRWLVCSQSNLTAGALCG
jgi:hypothetical protein